MQEDLASPTWGNQSSDRLGYDGAGRMITKRYLAGGIDGGSGAYNNSSSLVGQTTVFDKGSNKLYERELHAESRSHLYEPFDDQTPLGGYDSLDRLRQYQRGVLSTTGGQGNAGGGWIATPTSLPGTDENRTYDLDGLGNWHHTVFTPVGGSETDELRQHNGLNQITTINDGVGNIPFSYDGVTGASNGNLADDGIRTYKWDALNRLKEVRKKAGDMVVGEYEYDALNRRIRKVVSNGGLSGTIPNGVTDFVYNAAWQCVEERDGSNDPTKQYVWGAYIDELLQQKVDLSGTPKDQYPLQDLLYRTTALTDDSGNIVEAYDCDAYGNTLTFDAAGTGGNWWADDASQADQPTCEFIFTGRRFDSESIIYEYRERYYIPFLGRFIGRDPAGLRVDFNLYAYLRNFPVTALDPFGREFFVLPEIRFNPGGHNPDITKRVLEHWEPYIAYDRSSQCCLDIGLNVSFNLVSMYVELYDITYFTNGLGDAANRAWLISGVSATAASGLAIAPEPIGTKVGAGVAGIVSGVSAIVASILGLMADERKIGEQFRSKGYYSGFKDFTVASWYKIAKRKCPWVWDVDFNIDINGNIDTSPLSSVYPDTLPSLVTPGHFWPDPETWQDWSNQVQKSAGGHKR